MKKTPNKKRRWESVILNIQLLSSSRKLTRRIVFWLIVVVAIVASLIFGAMYIIEETWNFTEIQYFLVFIAVAVGVASIVGTVLSLIYSKTVKRITKPYIDALERVQEGDFTVTVQDSLLLKDSHVSESFNKMIRRLASVETLRENFISDFSHEFKTPIVSIAGFAKLLKDPNLTPEERNEFLDVIINESERLVNLSQSVLMLTRLDDQLVENENYLLDEQLRQSVLLFDKTLKDKNIEIDLNTQRLPICSCRKLLSQVWVNLIDNAIKFSSQDSTVTINANQSNGFVAVSVIDQGCGMDEETQQNIFNKFYQGDTSHAVEGNGLGLSIVQKILKLLGGKIEVQSKLGEGSTFTVTLPADGKK